MSGEQMSDRLSGRVESKRQRHLAVGHKGGANDNDSLSNQSFPMRVRPALAESLMGALSRGSGPSWMTWGVCVC